MSVNHFVAAELIIRPQLVALFERDQHFLAI